ncbi:MAG TPA: phenol degradation protein meta, partial [Roseiarcus sp.]
MKASCGAAFGIACAVAACCSIAARADEGGISFWVPGAYGSLAAVPLNPGWSLSGVYYPLFVSATGAAAVQREFELGGIDRTANFNLNLKVKSNADVVF